MQVSYDMNMTMICEEKHQPTYSVTTLVDSYSGRSRDMKICHSNQAPDLLGQLNSSLEYVA